MLSASAATPWDLVAAREQMALSLGWHIVLACFGVGMPALTLYAEWRGYRTGDPHYRLLARRWAKAMGVLFAVGAVSGTILSFEMGLLWPGLMGTYGELIGLPFAMEGIAFFIEAIFLGIYLYGWDRLPPRAHLWSGVPIIVAGVASAFFVVSANAWMNQPRGFDLVDGKLTNVDPWAAMFNPATPPQTVHMILAAFMVSGFGLASVYAVAMLRGRRDRYHQLGFLIPFVAAAAITPVQIGVGDWAAHFVADYQPTKLAAMEGVYHTERGVPLHIGGIAVDGKLRYAFEIPDGLSLLAHWDPGAEVQGLDQVQASRPASGQRGAPGVPDDGRARLRTSRARRLVRHRVATAPGPAALGVVLPSRRRIRGGRGRRARVRLGHHRGRSPTLGRLRPAPHHRRREHRTWPLDRPARGRRRIRRHDHCDRVRAAPTGTFHSGAGRSAGVRC